ncbi:MAG: hypothetical protein K2H89_06740 [Oscillospiraceae bacterium]|nr:hypothetical protein [Oscillospiraceae bacterium]
MNKILNSLYEQWCETQKDTPEYDMAYNVLCENENITPEQAKCNDDVLTECVNAESRKAFCAGFQTAVQLLMGGMQP